MDEILARRHLEAAKGSAAKMRATFSPIKKGEIAEEFLSHLVASVEALIVEQEKREQANGE